MRVDAPILPTFLATFTNSFIFLTILLDFIPYISGWSLWKWHVMRKCSYLLILWAKSLDQSVIGKLGMTATTQLTKSKSDFHMITLKKAPISKDRSGLVLVQSFWFRNVLGPVLLILEYFRTGPGPVLPKKAKRLDQTRLLNTNSEGGTHKETLCPQRSLKGKNRGWVLQLSTSLEHALLFPLKTILFSSDNPKTHWLSTHLYFLYW